MTRYMTLYNFLRCTALPALLLLAACAKQIDQGAIVAQVGDVVLTAADLDAQLPVGLDDETATAERAQFVENWVREELLYQEAIARQLDQNVRIQYLLEQARHDLLVATLLEREFAGREVEITNAIIEQYYFEHQDHFLRDQDEINARHILTTTHREANAAYQALQRGDEFEPVARKYSKDEDTYHNGGELGHFSQEDDPDLWEIAAAQALNRLSKPVKTDYGYHIIQVLDRQPAGTPKQLKQVRPHIVAAIVQQEQRQRLDELVKRLKDERAEEWSIRQEEVAHAP